MPPRAPNPSEPMIRVPGIFFLFPGALGLPRFPIEESCDECYAQCEYKRWLGRKRMDRTRTGWLAIVMIAFAAAPLWADERDDGVLEPEEQGSEVQGVFAGEASITAPYRAQFETPVTHTDLSEEAIERRNFGQEPSILLSEAPAMTFATDSGGIAGYSYFRLRGIDQTRVNMTLDGVPLNEPEDQGVYFSNYPDFLNSVAAIQIQRGVGTSSNGVASYAGSLLFETKRPGKTRAAEIGIGAGSHGTRRIYAEVSTPMGNSSGLYVRGSSLSSDGFKHHSGNDSDSLFFATDWAAGKHQIKVTGFAGHQENQLAWLGVPAEELRRDRRANGNTEEETDRFTQALLTVQHSVALSDSTTIASSIYFNHLNGDYDFDLDNFLGLGPGEDLYNYDFRSRFFGGFVNLSHVGPAIEFSAGVHANTYERRHRGSERSLGVLYENTGFKDEISAFAKAGVPVGDWLLFGDLQVRETSFTYDGTVEIDRLKWSFFNPRAGVSWRMDERLIAYFSVGGTSREPTRNDLFGGFDDLGVDDNGEPLLLDIPPESVVDYELGLRAVGALWDARVNVYWMVFEDEITLSGQFGPNGLPLHSNVASSFRRGLELEARADIGRGFTVIHSSSFSQNQITEAAERFEPVLSPEVVINQEVAFERDGFNASLIARYQGRSWIDFANTEEIGGSWTIDSRLGVGLGRFRIDLHGVNLLDEEAEASGAIRADGVPVFFVHPPRSVFATVRWTL
jgi:iron complex outermembrane receptor protein